jgi:hypothetical protein
MFPTSDFDNQGQAFARSHFVIDVGVQYLFNSRLFLDLAILLIKVQSFLFLIGYLLYLVLLLIGLDFLFVYFINFDQQI